MRRGSMGVVRGRGPIETKLPCPVCLIMMDKAQVKGRGAAAFPIPGLQASLYPRRGGLHQ